MMRRSSTVPLGLFLLAPALLAQTPRPGPASTAPPAAARTPAAAEHHAAPAPDPFRVQPLDGNVYALYGRGGNVAFFVGPEAVLVVDSQFKELAPGIVAQIRRISDKPIRFLVNTHHHGDHVGGNEVFRQFAMIVAHDNVRARMLASPVTILKEYPARLEEAKKSGNREFEKFLSDQIAWAKTARVEEIAAPVMTFDSALRIHMGDETIDVWHLPPAHTDGDSAVWFEKAKVLHMGDDFFNQVIPFVDVESGGSVSGYLAALDKVSGKVSADAVVIPGHGEVTDLAGLKAFRQYIADLLDAARKARAAGKSKEDFVRGADLAPYRSWKGYPERFKENAASAWDEAK